MIFVIFCLLISQKNQVNHVKDKVRFYSVCYSSGVLNTLYTNLPPTKSVEGKAWEKMSESEGYQKNSWNSISSEN